MSIGGIKALLDITPVLGSPAPGSDRIELEVEGVGRLRVKVRDALKRTWGRDTRLEHEQKGLPGRTPQLTGKYAKSPQ